MEVKNQKPAERCEVCHQTDNYDGVSNICTKCSQSLAVSPEELAASFQNQESQIDFLFEDEYVPCEFFVDRCNICHSESFDYNLLHCERCIRESKRSVSSISMDVKIFFGRRLDEEMGLDRPATQFQKQIMRSYLFVAKIFTRNVADVYYFHSNFYREWLSPRRFLFILHYVLFRVTAWFGYRYFLKSLKVIRFLQKIKAGKKIHSKTKVIESKLPQQ